MILQWNDGSGTYEMDLREYYEWPSWNDTIEWRRYWFRRKQHPKRLLCEKFNRSTWTWRKVI